MILNSFRNSRRPRKKSKHFFLSSNLQIYSLFIFSPNFLKKKSRKSAVVRLMMKKKAREAREALEEEIELDENGNEISDDANSIYVNPEDVSANIRTKMSKEERLEMIKVNNNKIYIYSNFFCITV